MKLVKLPAGKSIRNQTWCEFSWQRVKGSALLFLGKRDIKRIHPPRLRSVYPAAIWQRKNRVCSAPSFPSLGHRSAHPTHSILRTPYMRPDAAECSISAEFGTKRTHRTEPRSAGTEKEEKHHANPVQLSQNLTLFVCLNISTFTARTHLLTIKAQLCTKAWQHQDVERDRSWW